MAAQETLLVATVLHPTRCFRLSKAKFDEANVAAAAEGRQSPFIVHEDDETSAMQEAKSFDQLDKAGQKKAVAEQAARKAAREKEEARKKELAEAAKAASEE